VRVEQKGEMGFFFYKEPVAMLLDVHEEPPTRITARGIEGNIKGLETRYELHSSAAGVRLDLRGTLHPGLFHTPAHRHAHHEPADRAALPRAIGERDPARDALARAASKQK